MNNEEAKRYLPIIQALAEGKTIQYREKGKEDWGDVSCPNFYNYCEYRVKPLQVKRFYYLDASIFSPPYEAAEQVRDSYYPLKSSFIVEVTYIDGVPTNATFIPYRSS